MGGHLACRLALLATLVLLVLVGNTAAATAAGMGMAADDGVHRSGPFSWIHISDSNDIEIWMYGLSLDDGGITHLGRAFWAMLTELFWSFYQAPVNLSIWFLDWVISLGWLNVVASPLLMIGDGLQQMVDTLGLGPALLTITAFVAVIAMARGRWATGIFDLGLSLVIAAIATGVLAQPVRMVAGDDGWIAQAHTGGMQVASELSGADADGLDADGLRDQHAHRLSDAFLVQPLQMTNFGTTLSKKCTKVHAQATKEFKNARPGAPKVGIQPGNKQGLGDDGDKATNGFGLDQDYVRDEVGDCDAQAGEYASEPSAGMGMAALVFMPAGFVILAIAVLVGGATIVAGVTVLVQAVKVIFHLVTGLLPGGARGPLLLSISEAVMSLVILLTSTIVLEIFLLMIEAIFAAGQDADTPAIKTFAITDIVLVVGLVMVWRWRKNVKAASVRMAAWLGRHPGGAPARIPNQGSAAPAARAGRRVGSMVARPAVRGWVMARAARRPAQAGRDNSSNHDGTPDENQPSNPAAAQPANPASSQRGLPSSGPAGDGGYAAGFGGPSAGPRPSAGDTVRGRRVLNSSSSHSRSGGIGRIPVASSRRYPVQAIARTRTHGSRGALVRVDAHASDVTTAGSNRQYERIERDGHVMMVPKG